MNAEARYRRLLSALWVLLATARHGARADVAAAADAAAMALAEVVAGETFFLVQDRNGALIANGVRMGLDVVDFAAMGGLTEALQQRRVGELLLTRGVGANELAAWARAWSRVPTGADPDAELRRCGAEGIHASLRGSAADVPVSAGRAPAPVHPPAASLLLSVFLHHELIDAYGRDGLAPAVPAHVVLQATAERLVRTERGIEPLTVLQDDPEVLRTGVHVAVHAALLARAVGCPDRLVADVAAAALLHGLDAVLPKGPGAASAFRWLLERGQDDFWLRCALVARGWPGPHGRTLEQVGTDSSLCAAIVGVAERLDALVRREDRDAGNAFAALRADAAAGRFPAVLVDAAERTFAVA